MWRMDSVVTCTDGLRFSCIGAFVDVLQTVDVHASCRVAVQARRAAPRRADDDDDEAKGLL